MIDRRESSINSTTTIAVVPLDDGNIQGINFSDTKLDLDCELLCIWSFRGFDFCFCKLMLSVSGCCFTFLQGMIFVAYCQPSEPKVLLSGNDFYAFPRLDPKGERMT